MKRHAVLLTAVLLVLSLVGCEQQSDLPMGSFPNDEETTLDALAFARPAADEPAVARIAAFVEDVNAKLETGGSDLRLDYPWLFRVGPGTDPYASLRIGARWPKASLGYVLDESDYSTDMTAAEQEGALERSFQSWNDVARTYLEATRLPDDVGENPDLLDGTYAIVDGEEACPTVLDFTSSTLVGLAPGGGIYIDPPADILVGGWPDAKYFELCLGSESIIGVTWTLSTSDQNGDGYRDITYVEQFYNPAFNWATEGAQYLDFSDDALTDLETIAAHENGHALGLGHFGGPVNRQPFALQPNGKVFNPEAVMNPFYIGGEERTPLPTDVAGLTTLYTGHVSTTTE